VQPRLGHPHRTAERHVEWRQRWLCRAGFDPASAARLAMNFSFDLHALLELVDRGCPPDLAVRILEPLDGPRPTP
jgi:hypothetical protein